MSDDKSRKRGRVVVRNVRLTTTEDEALKKIARAMKMTVSRLLRHQCQPIFDHVQRKVS